MPTIYTLDKSIIVFECNRANWFKQEKQFYLKKNEVIWDSITSAQQSNKFALLDKGNKSKLFYLKVDWKFAAKYKCLLSNYLVWDKIVTL